MRLVFVWLGFGILCGCSALTSTDPDELGGGGRRDAGGGGIDSGGPREDAGPRPDTGMPPDPDGGPPACEPACTDGVACTIDQCVDGECQFSPDSSMCGDGMLCDPTAGCVVRHCEDDSECDDLQACNGVE